MPTLSLQATRLTHWLSYGGLIPFVAGALLAWIGPPDWRAQALAAIAGYGAVILSFIGAVHWGRVFASAQPDPAAPWWLLWGVTPTLVGWVALLLPAPWTSVVLLLGFALAWAVDQRAPHGLPSWYPRLRTQLSLAVGVTLAVTLPL